MAAVNHVEEHRQLYWQLHPNNNISSGTDRRNSHIEIFYIYCRSDALLEQDTSTQRCMCVFLLNLFSGYDVNECGFAGQKTAVAQSSRLLSVNIQGKMWSLRVLRGPDTASYSAVQGRANVVYRNVKNFQTEISD